MDARAVCAPLEHQFAIAVPLRQQVGQAPPIALFVHRDAIVMAASRAAGARDHPGISDPPGILKVPWCAVHRSLGLVHSSAFLASARPVARELTAVPENSPSATDAGRFDATWRDIKQLSLRDAPELSTAVLPAPVEHGDKPVEEAK
jgi:hypothetical protein